MRSRLSVSADRWIELIAVPPASMTISDLNGQHIRYVRVAAPAGYSVSELQSAFSACRRIRLGWDPDSEEEALPETITCWLLINGSWQSFGNVVMQDDTALRQRFADYQAFLLHGGMGRRILPLAVFRGVPACRSNGEAVFVVELLRLPPRWIGDEPDWVVEAGRRMARSLSLNPAAAADV